MVRKASLFVDKLISHWKKVLNTTITAREMTILNSLSKSTLSLPTQQSTPAPINIGTARESETPRAEKIRAAARNLR